jgi:hypothetical protein
MKKIIAGLIFIFVLTSCGAKTEIPALANCYHGHVGDSDSVFTIEKQSGSNLSGQMAFVFAQKDSSHGTYEGTFSKGVLKAKYLFWSEGVQSVGDYVFTQNGKNLVGSGYTYIPAQDCRKYLQK